MGERAGVRTVVLPKEILFEIDLVPGTWYLGKSPHFPRRSQRRGRLRPPLSNKTTRLGLARRLHSMASTVLPSTLRTTGEIERHHRHSPTRRGPQGPPKEILFEIDLVPGTWYLVSKMWGFRCGVHENPQTPTRAELLTVFASGAKQPQPRRSPNLRAATAILKLTKGMAALQRIHQNSWTASDNDWTIESKRPLAAFSGLWSSVAATSGQGPLEAATPHQRPFQGRQRQSSCQRPPLAARDR